MADGVYINVIVAGTVHFGKLNGLHPSSLVFDCIYDANLGIISEFCYIFDEKYFKNQIFQAIFFRFDTFNEVLG